MKKQLFIRGDLNSLHDGIIPLKNDVWIDTLKKEYGQVSDGLKIWLFELTIKNNKYDPTIFPGVIRDISKGDEFEILVNEKDMEYLSESKEFGGYTLEDIIGKQLFDSLKKQYPKMIE